jgi:hypothetical protein
MLTTIAALLEAYDGGWLYTLGRAAKDKPAKPAKTDIFKLPTKH